MKTTNMIGERQVGMPQHASVSYLHSVAQPVAIRAPVSRLQQALRQLDDLKRALASSRQELVAARAQVRALSTVNGQLKGLAVQREGAPKTLPYPAWELTDFSLSAGLDPHEMLHIERLLNKRIRLRKGDALYRFGDVFDTLYAIQAGSCKTVLLGRDGQYKVTGYHMLGEIIGMDGVGSNVYACEATALEDMQVWPLPFARIEKLAQFCDQFRDNLHKLLAEEYARVLALTVVLATNRAEQRVAVFLLDLSQRYQARGFSSCEFVLRLTRAEIGSYLGLKVETVSRQLTRFQREGLIQVEGRVVKLLDLVALSLLVDS
jgi:CRP/FNR family transcriptional regulator, anaerobic regulatory protein